MRKKLKENEKYCEDCFEYGHQCLAGRSAHPNNWFKCETCDGKGVVLKDDT